MPDPSHIIVIPSLKILYCITPKVASRQWREMLLKFKQNLPGEPVLSQFAPDDQSRKWEKYFKFTFVREPFERILSAYRDKFVYPRFPRQKLQLHGSAILRSVRPNASKSAFEKLDDITFREFIEYIITKGGNKSTPVMNWHWDNYVNICGMCAVNYDFIGHYETFDQDLADFKVAAGLSPEQAKRFNARANNKSSTSTSMLSYYSKIPIKWIEILGRLYRANFEMFGYDFPGPLKSLFE